VTNSDYRAARHYTARHEIRENFPLTLLDPGAASVEYPGVHAYVGGGYANGVEGKKNWLSFVTCYGRGLSRAGTQWRDTHPSAAMSDPDPCARALPLVGRNSSDEELVASFVRFSPRVFTDRQ
jgi:hypothetical protein